MVNGCVITVCLLLFEFGRADLADGQQWSEFKHDFGKIQEVISKWAPLIWLHPQEKYMPLSTDDFLRHVWVAQENGKTLYSPFAKSFSKYNANSYLVTQKSLEELKNQTDSFLYGKNPNKYSVPVYAVINYCSSSRKTKTYSQKEMLESNSIKVDPDSTTSSGTAKTESIAFHISYWTFYPYNEGKELCFLGKVPAPKIFNRCFGHTKTLGNHIGDWEHLSLSFKANMQPLKLYLAVHDGGVYYNYDPLREIFKYEAQVDGKGVVPAQKYPPIVRLQNGHPVLFSAYGSHGLWAAPGEHYFVKIPRLTDRNDYGTPWKTWNNIAVYHVGKSFGLPNWVAFKGHWGNPKSKCLLFKKICENSDGPTGVLRKKQDFYCDSTT